MARNTLIDLNNHLFEQLEKLREEDLTQEQLEIEIIRAKAVNSIAKNIIDNARVSLDGAQFAYQKLSGKTSIPEQFRLKEITP